ncbi:Lrp/AsnC family transcriptional regulator [Microbacterium phyllosphaerae]|uniref:Lrp/AsnC family transcriptional regulator n=1 Tax=Microbacterium phyllosphaerae TaxID=124798 RepID=UPI0021683618|nr:Lrp/AsnC family transcriptional regulator [Microbacterium phyllosphaerae]MCS3443912.1 DNA-binding Lrp family transcriptional regulator [Microbacterium phyllosphaerae]
MTFTMTDADRRILRELSQDGRLSNKELAVRVGLAPSTCHGRVRMLEDAGVIRGYRAVVDAQAAGAAISALISVAVLNHARSQVTEIVPLLQGVPGVQQVFLLGGDRDIVVHVAMADVPSLREFIRVHIGSHPDLGQSQTQLIFEHAIGGAPA